LLLAPDRLAIPVGFDLGRSELTCIAPSQITIAAVALILGLLVIQLRSRPTVGLAVVRDLLLSRT
jgi:hypothetical protein